MRPLAAHALGAGRFGAGLRSWPAVRLRAIDRRFDVVVAALPRGFRKPGAGRGAAIGLIAAFGFYGALLAASSDPVAPIATRVADGLGFVLERIEISGHSHLDEGAVLDLVGIVPGVALPWLDADAARTRLEASPWIEAAEVRKLYPSRLSIDIREADPFAVWQHDRTFHVVRRDGAVLSEVFPGNLPDLPLLVGPGANTGAAALFDLMLPYPEIAVRATTAQRVAERRWTLRLHPGIDVLLPEIDVDAALAQLDDLITRQGIAERAVSHIDLRLPDRVVVKLMALDAEDDAEPGRGA
ncbi:MAG: cell division protein FtsQ/DivIB [Pseudomonadota bacterium]